MHETHRVSSDAKPTSSGEGDRAHKDHYRRLFIMAGLSLISMYVLMYSMVDTVANVYANLNQFYMAGLMTAPMVVIEVLVMRVMYPRKGTNALIIGASALVGLGLFAAIRQQTAISDGQFLRSMIPHHASAVLMCERASLQDPELEELCRDILSSQQAQIDQMRAKLLDLES